MFKGRVKVAGLLVALVCVSVPAAAGAMQRVAPRLVPQVGYPYSVSVSVTGPGSVTDGTVAGAGQISCPGTCTASYSSGQSDTLTETPQPGAQFAGWSTTTPTISGCTATSTTCVIRIACDACGSGATVSATFTPVSEPLSVSVTGPGSVGDSTGTISCPSSCQGTYKAGLPVTLTEVPNSGQQFAGWSTTSPIISGCTATSTTCAIRMTSAASVSATFEPVLAVQVSGSGTVTGPGGINCSSGGSGTCSLAVTPGAQTQLTAAPGSGFTFGSWSGGPCDGQGATCSLTLNNGASVVATFVALPAPDQLTVNIAGAGSGTVTDSTNAINCPGTCQAGFPNGTHVTLTAAPASGYMFSAWSGGPCDGQGASCTLTMSAAESVTATFTQVPVPATATPPTITGPAPGPDYVGPRPAGAVVANTTLTCHQGNTIPSPWTFDGYYWFIAGSEALAAQGPYNNPNSAPVYPSNGATAVVTPADVDYLHSWSATGISAVGCDETLFQPGALSNITQNADVLSYVPLLPAQPVMVKPPRIETGLALGSIEPCSPGAYQSLYGLGKFSYQWLLGRKGASTRIVGTGTSVRIDPGWVGGVLACRVTITPGTGWKQFTEVSNAFKVLKSVEATSPAVVTVDTSFPTGTHVYAHGGVAQVTAADVRLTCAHGSWSNAGGATYAYSWVLPDGSVEQGQTIDFAMEPGREQYDLDVRCRASITSANGEHRSQLSARILVWNGCTESIDESGNDGGAVSVQDWAYFQEAGLTGLQWAQGGWIAGPTQVDGEYATGYENSDGIYQETVDTLFELYIDPYPISTGLFHLPASGIPGLGTWHADEQSNIGRQVVNSGGLVGPPSELGSHDFTPARSSANVYGPNCSGYASYLSDHGYHVSAVPTPGKLIPR